MVDKELERSSTTQGLPVAPSMGPAMAVAAVAPVRGALMDSRVIVISLLSLVVAAFAAIAAEALVRLIGLVTNISFFGRVSDHFASPAGNHLGLLVIIVPVIGGIIVGYMARYGSSGIRGHGIPEAMEQVLRNQSRIAPRLMFLKPISAAIAIGTGGPFGAEGPIIATGGAMGSVLGQLISTTATERKTLLAAGAAAGMAATFGSPVSAVLLAVELLLFEFRPRTFIPVALAATTAAGIRFTLGDPYPMFNMPQLHDQPTGWAMLAYFAIGALVGIVSVGVTRAVYWIEDLFEHLPVHWMWWPAIGSIPLGIIGYFRPDVLGVGYTNITAALSGEKTLSFLAILGLLKFIAWAISLGSGTSGGTLAPLFTIGGALGAVCGGIMSAWWPAAGIDARVGALVGMAAMFSGASRAMLTSVVFAFETTLQPMGLLPLLGGCTAAFFVSCVLMPNTIMTEKIARRGVRVPTEYEADFLEGIIVKDVASKSIIPLQSDWTLQQARQWIDSGQAGTTHQGYPIVDAQGHLLGVLTRRDLLNPSKDAQERLGELIHHRPVIVYPDVSLREAADHMVNHNIGRLPVIDRESRKVIGMITRSDLLSAHGQRIKENQDAVRSIRWPARSREENAATQHRF